jgi:transposase-like protein
MFAVHAMTLSLKLKGATLSLPCPRCKLPLTRKGSWFLTAAWFKCAECGYREQLTYDTKQKLFDRARPVVGGPG